MAARPAQAPPSMEQFEAYFQRADLNRDGRISGDEAVAFFQGSGLPKNVLAQIWTYSDQKNAGFLGRPEFFNALRLVTVAQTGHALTPDIVKAALEGPAAARIPAPRINPVAAPTPNPMSVQRPQFNNMMPSSTVMGSMPPSSYQNAGFRGPQPQLLPNTATNAQMFPSGDNKFNTPVQGAPISSSVQMQPGSQGPVGGAMTAAGPRLPGSNIPNLSTDWFSSRSSGPPAGAIAHPPGRGLAPPSQEGFGLGLPSSNATTTSMLRPQAASPPTQSSQPLDTIGALTRSVGQDSKALAVSGNGFSSGSGFGTDVFSALQPKQEPQQSTFPSSRVPGASSSPSVLTGPQPKAMPVGPSQSLQSAPVGGGLLQTSQSLANTTQLGGVTNTMMPTSSIGAGMPGSISSQPQAPWPKMTQSNILKYTKVFVEVDKDRDGKITGEEARNLFLSWRLPREVLKQVWDLSDQDNDGMLSIGEFCVALYLMERYREGRPLPSVLPNSLKFDDALLQVSKQPSAGYVGLAASQPNPSFPQQVTPGIPPLSAPGLRPQQQMQAPRSHFDGQMQYAQQKIAVPSLTKQSFNQFSNEGQSALTGNKEEITDADLKVKEQESEIMDSKEKLEYYRTKMQDLVLYKSRCDNRLNEITENASASKREMEDLAKRYEEKYKQVGEIASKLTVEEATFRDIQERKLELHNAIIKMEQGGSTDGLLQVRADRIQSDLEELGKALHDRCKKHGFNMKSAFIVELPFGWEPGIQEGAADWDEDWDKFEDEGFILSKDLTVGAETFSASTKNIKPSSGLNDDLFSDGAYPDAYMDVGRTKPYSAHDHDIINDAAYAQSEDGSERSPPGSPRRSADYSPDHTFNSTKFDSHDASPRLNGNYGDHGHGGADSFFSDEKFGDESSWGAAFDAGDDTDSVWGFNATDKEFGQGTGKQRSSFDSRDFGPSSIKTGSPSKSSIFGKERSPFFADSVPGTPSFNSGPSPRSSEDRPSFESFGHYDSFNTQGNLGRFDSMRSSADFDQGGLFGQRENIQRFDSIRSTQDSSHSRAFQSFDEADPFGTGPFKPLDAPKRSSDNWSAF